MVVLRGSWSKMISFCLYLLHFSNTLISKEEEIDEHNNQVKPPGFHVIFLPFTDDLRRLKYEQTPKGAKLYSFIFNLFHLHSTNLYPINTLLILIMIIANNYCHCLIIVSATTEQINKAKQVIKNLTSGFDSSNFENPCKFPISVSRGSGYQFLSYLHNYYYY